MTTNETTRLNCGRTVPTSLYESLRKHVIERRPKLEPGVPYMLKMVCDASYWARLGKMRNAAGWVMAHLVEEGLVPYLFASERDSKPLWYRLKQ